MQNRAILLDDSNEYTFFKCLLICNRRHWESFVEDMLIDRTNLNSGIKHWDRFMFNPEIYSKMTTTKFY